MVFPKRDFEHRNKIVFLHIPLRPDHGVFHPLSGHTGQRGVPEDPEELRVEQPHVGLAEEVHR